MVLYASWYHPFMVYMWWWFIISSTVLVQKTSKISNISSLGVNVLGGFPSSSIQLLSQEPVLCSTKTLDNCSYPFLHFAIINAFAIFHEREILHNGYWSGHPSPSVSTSTLEAFHPQPLQAGIVWVSSSYLGQLSAIPGYCIPLLSLVHSAVSFASTSPKT